ncbi:MAG TPA: hypothetical protein VHN98_04940 [Acidimicrobiales bacterium]|nr:hypothetical protein [Acidimicrobiales bacterium]
MTLDRDDRDDLAEAPPSHSDEAVAPGASGPGEPGYEGRATVGDFGATADAVSFEDPDGDPDTTVEEHAEQVAAAAEADPPTRR